MRRKKTIGFFKEEEFYIVLVSGRGLLGRWGPNHAADPVVTRWDKSQLDEQQPVPQVILVNRKDTGELALPRGMVDPGFDNNNTHTSPLLIELLL